MLSKNKSVETSKSHTVTFGQIETKKQYKGILNPFFVQWIYSPFNTEVVFRCENGKTVKKGDIVLSYEIDLWDKEIESHEEGIDDKNVVINDLKLQHKSGLEKADLDLAQRKLRYKLAMYNLNLAKNSPIELVKEEQNLILLKEKLTKDFIESKFKSEELMYDKGLVSLKSLQTLKVKLLNAESNYLRVKIKYSELMKGTPKIRLNQLQKFLDLEKMKFDDAQDNIKRLKLIQEYQINKELSGIQSISNKIKRFKKHKSDSYIKAPFDSKVYFPGVYKGSSANEPIEIGENPMKGVGLLFFTNSMDYIVNFIISESELSEINLGDEITFQLNSDPSVVIEGTVSKFSALSNDKNVQLGSLALERNGEAGVRVIKVTARLKNSNEALRHGITGTIFFKTKSLSKLICPLNCIFIKNGKAYVKLKGDNEAQVTVGKNDGFMAELITGVKEGDQIIYDR